MNFEKLLPLGSILNIKEEKKRIMIIGYYSGRKEDNNKIIYDYIGCLYPYGLNGDSKILTFNHEDIRIIYFIGFNDLESQLYNKTIIKEYEKIIKKIKKDNN